MVTGTAGAAGAGAGGTAAGTDATGAGVVGRAVTGAGPAGAGAGGAAGTVVTGSVLAIAGEVTEDLLTLRFTRTSPSPRISSSTSPTTSELIAQLVLARGGVAAAWAAARAPARRS